MELLQERQQTLLVSPQDRLNGFRLLGVRDKDLKTARVVSISAEGHLSSARLGKKASERDRKARKGGRDEP